MPTFALAAQAADRTGLPVVEGFAVQLKDDADEATVSARVTAEVNKRLPEYQWTAGKLPDRWRVYHSGDGAPDSPPPLGAAWEVVRALKQIRGVEIAEPLLLTRLPVTNGSDAQRSFRLWGTVSDARLAQIQAASDAQHVHWSLVQMGVCDEEGKNGAWAAWKAKPGNEDKTPGAGVLVAHPDTGYTKHARLLPHLEPHKDDTSLSGKNFVERGAPDGRDPMADTAFGNFPGHGTSTASVIVTGSTPTGAPWGVAPGAKILPLRVSSSIIHLSFQNLCDAFVEAMERGAHVISMSLGGPLGSELLTSLVHRALDKGIIVVAAAGNYAPTVVFPARIPGVIACAAGNALSAPWRFSGLGAEVAITAPGELVWHDWERLDAVDDQASGTGTSYAVANVAGLAALWLSYWGRDTLKETYGENGIPFAFRLALQKSAAKKADFLRGGKGGFGEGIAQADALLLDKNQPTPKAVDDARTAYLAQKTGHVVGFPLNTWWIILTLPTLTADGPWISTPEESDERRKRIENLLAQIVGPGCDDNDHAEIGALASTDAGLQVALEQAGRGGRNCVSAAAVRRYLLRKATPLSDSLRGRLQTARDAAHQTWNQEHPELSPSPRLPSAGDEEKKIAYAIAPPPTRRLRAFAFDPSLATQSATAAVNEITIPVVFECSLEPGPVGDYLEVVDVDPASDCAYAPVDLNHPFLLAQDGLRRSEGNPQFHQQMVYAVAMKTISHFEEALGRPIFWSPLRPWDWRGDDDDRAAKRFNKDEAGNVVRDDSDQFVQRLRLYPHALREQNAYYSPQKRAILFGYFPAGDSDPGAEYPGGVVFTCLAYDIIAHETTHAILDGMHVRYTEPTNPDVFAFHEAFADIVALFQRFTYPELLRDQIARARGRLDAGTLMSQLALQFGQAIGRRQALRDALGHVVRQGRQRGETEWRDRREEGEPDGGGASAVTLADAAREFGEEERRLWKRFQADPSLVAQVEEPHERGSFLVAAVFDAYLRIYEDRVADLKRIATGGTGVLPDGELHPDLVNRMANEAAKSAGHVKTMCIRAMDYVPPTDITFGEFLRALITADTDLVPDDDRRYRVAFIEAFRKWGIYPRDVRTLSEETLRWSPPGPERKNLFPKLKDLPEDQRQEIQATIGEVRHALLDWQPGKSRGVIFDKIKAAQGMLWRYFRDRMPDETREALLSGIDTGRTFQVTNLRPARRIGPRGEFLTEMVVEILQSKNALPYDEKERRAEEARRRTARQERKKRGEAEEPESLPFRGGVTLIVSMDDYTVRYAIHKRADSAARAARQREFLLRAGVGIDPDVAEYSTENLPPGWYSDASVRAKWREGRNSHRESMRASSCACRRGRMEDDERKDAEKAAKKAGISVPNALTEPFALLHRV